MIPLTEAEALLPALSVTLAGPAPRFPPSPVMTLLAGWVAGSMPERPSAAGPLDRDVVLVPAGRVRVGGRGAGQARAVRSMLMPSTRGARRVAGVVERGAVGELVLALVRERHRIGAAGDAGLGVRRR